MKNLFLTFTFFTIVSAFISCTAEELPKEKIAQQEAVLAKDGAIEPPINSIPPKKP